MAALTVMVVLPSPGARTVCMQCNGHVRIKLINVYLCILLILTTDFPFLTFELPFVPIISSENLIEFCTNLGF